MCGSTGYGMRWDSMTRFTVAAYQALPPWAVVTFLVAKWGLIAVGCQKAA